MSSVLSISVPAPRKPRPRRPSRWAASGASRRATRRGAVDGRTARDCRAGRSRITRSLAKVRRRTSDRRPDAVPGTVVGRSGIVSHHHDGRAVLVRQSDAGVPEFPSTTRCPGCRWARRPGRLTAGRPARATATAASDLRKFGRPVPHDRQAPPAPTVDCRPVRHPGGHAVEHQPEGHVLDGREHRHQIEELEDESRGCVAGMPLANLQRSSTRRPCAPTTPCRGRGHRVHRDAAESTFPPRGTGDHDELPIHRDVEENSEPLRRPPVRLGDSRHFEDRLRHREIPFSEDPEEPGLLELTGCPSVEVQ